MKFLSRSMLSFGIYPQVWMAIAILPTLSLPIDSVRAQSEIPVIIPVIVPEIQVEELHEEVLRQEVILDGRSPLDGQPLTATEYAELQVEIDRLNEVTPQVSPKLRQLIGLLKFRKILKRVLPIVPIK